MHVGAAERSPLGRQNPVNTAHWRVMEQTRCGGGGMSASVSRGFLTSQLAAALMSTATLSILVVTDSQAFCCLCLLILHYTDGCAVSMATFLSNQSYRFRRHLEPSVNLSVVKAAWNGLLLNGPHVDASGERCAVLPAARDWLISVTRLTLNKSLEVRLRVNHLWVCWLLIGQSFICDVEYSREKQRILEPENVTFLLENQNVVVEMLENLQLAASSSASNTKR